MTCRGREGLRSGRVSDQQPASKPRPPHCLRRPIRHRLPYGLRNAVSKCSVQNGMDGAAAFAKRLIPIAAIEGIAIGDIGSAADRVLSRQKIRCRSSPRSRSHRRPRCRDTSPCFRSSNVHARAGQLGGSRFACRSALLSCDVASALSETRRAICDRSCGKLDRVIIKSRLLPCKYSRPIGVFRCCDGEKIESPCRKEDENKRRNQPLSPPLPNVPMSPQLKVSNVHTWIPRARAPIDVDTLKFALSRTRIIQGTLTRLKCLRRLAHTTETVDLYEEGNLPSHMEAMGPFVPRRAPKTVANR